MAAMGRIANAAEKKIMGGDTAPMCSNATVMGTKRNSQLIGARRNLLKGVLSCNEVS